MQTESAAASAEPLSASIREIAVRTGESEWTVKNKLRRGIYRAKKSGRRTLVLWDSVKTHLANLPDAKFVQPKQVA